MKCAACHNQMVRKKGMIDLTIGGKFYFVRNITHEECPVCGEKVLSPEVSQDLYNKIKNKQYVEEIFNLPVLDSV